MTHVSVSVFWSVKIQPINVRWHLRGMKWSFLCKYIELNPCMNHAISYWRYAAVIFYLLAGLHPRAALVLSSGSVRTERRHRHPVPAGCLVLHWHRHLHLWQQPLDGRGRRETTEQRYIQHLLSRNGFKVAVWKETYHAWLFSRCSSDVNDLER